MDLSSSEARDAISFADHTIHHMRCSVHSFQLGVRDGLKKPSAQNFLSKVRNNVILLRTPHKDSTLKRHAKMGCVIDLPTRWGSTYKMLKRFRDLRPHIHDLGLLECPLSNQEWEKVRKRET